MRLKNLAITIAILGSCTISTQTAFAETTDNQSLSVSPQIIETTVARGEQHAELITLKNNSQNPITIHASIDQTVQLPNNSNRLANSTQDQSGISSITTLSENDITLASGEEKKVTLKIEPNNTSEERGYSASINFTGKNTDQNGNNTIGTTIKTILLINIGKNNDSVTLKSFEQTDENNQINFTTAIDNVGPTLSKSKGKINIYDTWGTLIKTIPINENGLNIVPGTERTFQSQLDTKILGSGWYTAQAEIYYGNPKTKTTSQKITFFHANKTKSTAALALLLLLPLTLHLITRKKPQK